ncbi:MAG: hypothetical protein NTZ16_01585 [Verrucomicrobia bacterium]|nr:hypothetical protein [Verrucomicrobiota bacterium]
MKFPGKWRLSVSVLCFGVLAVAGANRLQAQTNDAAGLVTPIGWAKFKSGPAQGADAERFGKILLNANKYALTTWWAERGFAQSAADGYLNFKSAQERSIRPAAAEAQGLAVSLRLGLYRAEATGVSREEAEGKVVALVRSLTHRHRANSPGSTNGWGSVWQSPAWAAYTVMAGWLMWEKLEPVTRTELVKMAESEAEWVMTNKKHPHIKTYRDRAGKIISPGDTGTEENAWDASMLVAATAMMPQHPQHSRWINKLITLMLLAHARPSDVSRTNVYHGKPLSQWLPGSNMNEDGTVINHGRVHPDYMVAGLLEFSPACFYGLAQRPLPAAGVFNLELPYMALADLKFVAGEKYSGRTALPPGGTMFLPDSAAVYFPQGNDWGTERREDFAYADAVRNSGRRSGNKSTRKWFCECRRGFPTAAPTATKARTTSIPARNASPNRPRPRAC